LAANSQEMTARVTRLCALALAGPLTVGGLMDASTGSRAIWMTLRGMSEDRLKVLGEEYAVTWLLDSLRDEGRELVEHARASGHRIVLISDHLEPLVHPLADQLGADTLFANRMEIRDGRVTGRLKDPVVARFGGRLLLDYASANQIDLSRSLAYGAREQDAMFLAKMGQPCAVYPDRALRRIARDLSWPVVEGA
jgi:putative phosphoserine phosphatase/1-acylglycerol-3-phosphate O-acyltransferase